MCTYRNALKSHTISLLSLINNIYNKYKTYSKILLHKIACLTIEQSINLKTYSFYMFFLCTLTSKYLIVFSRIPFQFKSFKIYKQNIFFFDINILYSLHAEIRVRRPSHLFIANFV